MLKTNRNNHTCITPSAQTAHIMPLDSLPFTSMPLDSLSFTSKSIPPAFNWLQIMMEGHMDGMMLLTKEGRWLMVNQAAKEMCDRLTPRAASTHALPKDIRRCCQHLIDSRETYPDNMVVLDSEITTDDGFTLRVRVQWFRLQGDDADTTYPERPQNPQYILVILEDQERSIRNRALFEARQFGLSPREQEVWLLRRTNHAMQEIADILVISLNTVKKHLKSIYFKQRSTTFLNS